MNYIFESMFVGIYSCIIYVFIRNVVNNVYVLFFVTGFIKHLLGYLLNIHSLYCKYTNKILEVYKMFYELTLTLFLFG